MPLVAVTVIPDFMEAWVGFLPVLLPLVVAAGIVAWVARLS